MNAAPMHPAFACALMASDASAPPGLRAWNAPDPGMRFAVHRNNVRVSLAAALAETFPVLRQLVGEEFFRVLAMEYLRASPPRSPVLLEYGEDFGDFIAAFAPAAQFPYLADVARLEQLRVQSFHAADERPLPPENFRAWLTQPERLAGLRFVLHPSLRLLRSPWAVLSVWRLHQEPNDRQRDQGLAALALDRAEDVLIWRPHYEVQASALPPGAFDCLLALQRGDALAVALDAASVVPGFELQSMFDRLVHDGLVVDIIGPDLYGTQLPFD